MNIFRQLHTFALTDHMLPGGDHLDCLVRSMDREHLVK